MTDPWNGKYARKLQDLEFYYSASPTRCVVTRTMEKCLFNAPSTSRSQRIHQVETPKSTTSFKRDNLNKPENGLLNDSKSVMSSRSTVSKVSTKSHKSQASTKSHKSQASTKSQKSLASARSNKSLASARSHKSSASMKSHKSSASKISHSQNSQACKYCRKGTTCSKVKELEHQLKTQRRERLLAEKQLCSTIRELHRLERYLQSREESQKTPSPAATAQPSNKPPVA